MNKSIFIAWLHGFLWRKCAPLNWGPFTCHSCQAMWNKWEAFNILLKDTLSGPSVWWSRWWWRCNLTLSAYGKGSYTTRQPPQWAQTSLLLLHTHWEIIWSLYSLFRYNKKHWTLNIPITWPYRRVTGFCAEYSLFQWVPCQSVASPAASWI